MRALVFALPLLAASLCSGAQAVTVGELANMCRSMGQASSRDLSWEEIAHLARCTGMIEAVTEMILITNQLLQEQKKERIYPVCVPHNATVQQGALVFMNWATENPTMHHVLASQGVLRSYLLAWSCNKERS
jgi:hypothetical protein